MFGNTIAKRVAKVMESRIRMGEERYKKTCAQIDHDSAEKVKAIYTQQEQDKMNIADEIVKSILG